MGGQGGWGVSGYMVRKGLGFRVRVKMLLSPHRGESTKKEPNNPQLKQSTVTQDNL